MRASGARPGCATRAPGSAPRSTLYWSLFLFLFHWYDTVVYMKICLVHNLYPPYAKGGAEKVVEKTAQELLSLGHEVFVITTSSDKEYNDVVDGVRVYRRRAGNLYAFADGNKHSFLSRFIWQCVNLFHINQARWVRRILEKEKPDVVHTHNLMGLSFLIPSVIRKLNIPHVHTLHDVQLVEPSGVVLYNKQNSFRYNNSLSFLYSYCTQILLGSPDAVVSPSRFLLDWYKQKGFFKNTKQLSVIQNSLPEMSDKGDKQIYDVTRFLFVGQLETHKGLKVLLEAWKLIVQKQISAQLVIAGSGSLVKEVSEYAVKTDSVSYVGHLTHGQLEDMLYKTDIVIFPSICIENSPTVLFESIMSCTPVIASDMESIREIVQEGREGYFVSVGDSVALANKIIWCVENRDDVTNLSKQMSLVVKQKRAPAEELLDLYKKVRV